MIVAVTEKGPYPHQIILMSGRSGNLTAVSCNCLLLTLPGSAFKGGHKPMGEVENTGDLSAVWELYDDPKNHNTNGAPFEPGERTPLSLHNVR